MVRTNRAEVVAQPFGSPTASTIGQPVRALTSTAVAWTSTGGPLTELTRGTIMMSTSTMPTTASQGQHEVLGGPHGVAALRGCGRRHPHIVADGRPGRPIAPAIGLSSRTDVIADKDEMTTTTSTAPPARRSPRTEP